MSSSFVYFINSNTERTCSAFDNYFLHAQAVRQLIRSDFDAVFRGPNVLRTSTSSDTDGVDVLIYPSTINTARPLGQVASDPLSEYAQDVLNVPASLAGIPAISVSAGRSADGWPVGVQVAGQWGCDLTVLQVANAIHGLTDS